MEIFRKVFNERNLVVILFVMVMVTFSLAQNESKKLDKIYIGFKAGIASPFVSVESKTPVKAIQPEKTNPFVN